VYGADYWHHQMVFGVDARGVYMTNPVECLSFDELLKGLVSDSVLLVHTSDVKQCRPQDPEAIDGLGGRWAELRVAEQVRAVASSREPHVSIPAAYNAGVTVFAKKGTLAAEALASADELPLAK